MYLDRHQGAVKSVSRAHTAGASLAVGNGPGTGEQRGLSAAEPCSP